VIGAHTGTFVDRMRVAPLQKDILSGAHDEECRAESEKVEAVEIDVTAIHDVACPCLGNDLVEDVDVVHFAVRVQESSSRVQWTRYRAFGGQRPRDNNFTVEGVDNNNNESVTGALITVPNDSVLRGRIRVSGFGVRVLSSTLLATCSLCRRRAVQVPTMRGILPVGHIGQIWNQFNSLSPLTKHDLQDIDRSHRSRH
jgi:hypothetical protein